VTTINEAPHFRFSLLLKEIDNLSVADGVSTVALALVQLDGMEEINERFGYLGGDKVLKEFAVRLAAVVDDNGRTFEITGTSFALLIQNPLHEGDAVYGAERIANAASDPITIGGAKAYVHARMGISLMPDPAATAEELLRQCEIALSKARENGETYRIFTPELGQSGGQTTKFWFDVDKAIKQGEFELHYQPTINLRSGRLVGAQALIRWQGPRAGMIPPSYFLPDITNVKGVRTMLQFVLNSALKLATQWVQEIPDFSLAVNLAPQNVTDPELFKVVDESLERQSFPADRLILEITEDSLAGNEETVIAQLVQLRKRGIRIAIDRYGAGHLGVGALKKLPADQLKLDRTLVVPVSANETDRRIASAVIELAHAVDLEVVAEGVEDADIMQTLVAMGCEVGEGFHFSRPIPAADFASTWVAKFSRSPAISA